MSDLNDRQNRSDVATPPLNSRTSFRSKILMNWAVTPFYGSGGFCQCLEQGESALSGRSAAKFQFPGPVGPLFQFILAAERAAGGGVS